ncbi:MAG TPA: hypothetical protein VKI17_06235, partial [Gemmataceae bacterium]|nr:hypothetical protein [Gemmataceae bacterium]
MQISTSPKKLSRFRGRGHRLASFKPTLEPLEERTLLNAGALDQTFGMNGEVMSNFSLSNFTTALLQTDGKIVVVGSAGPSVSILALARYNPDGSLDSSFGMGGVEYSPLIGGAAAAALQADGAILVAGGRNEESVLARFTTSGAPDSTFGTGGSVTTSIPELTGVAVAPDGKIILAGFGFPPPSYSSTIELQRYNPNGTLDTTFGSGGTATDPAGGAQSSRLLTQPDGKILLVETIGGTMANGYITPFLVKRYNADGSVDQGFQVPVNVGTGFNAAEDVAL